ncbi:auxin-responsive protein SAUR72 [Trifolium pratense]|uniref:auxin-responsive protein SAUR72 n=1 Tax=Trifolium pratense TaxID=57577 RepID=UPI001E6957AB|nr:auxin-responsive protein SAUR72 [Trifolium pratense]
MDQKKSNKIREIVRLQQILKKWRRIANSSKTTTSTTTNNITNSKSMKFLKRTLSLSEREGTITSSNNGSVPKGYLAVCVGEELKRFIIPTEYLGHQAFQILLREAEEEFGFQQTGVLRIPCEVSVFESILKMVEDGKKNDKFSSNQECRSLNIEEMMGFCSLENQLACSHHPQSPLCR